MAEMCVPPGTHTVCSVTRHCVQSIGVTTKYLLLLPDRFRAASPTKYLGSCVATRPCPMPASAPLLDSCSLLPTQSPPSQCCGPILNQIPPLQHCTPESTPHPTGCILPHYPQSRSSSRLCSTLPTSFRAKPAYAHLSPHALSWRRKRKQKEGKGLAQDQNTNPQQNFHMNSGFLLLWCSPTLTSHPPFLDRDLHVQQECTPDRDVHPPFTSGSRLRADSMLRANTEAVMPPCVPCILGHHPPLMRT